MNQTIINKRRLTAAKVLGDSAHHKTHIFDAPPYENKDEEALSEPEEIFCTLFRVIIHYKALTVFQNKIPFAIVGSNQLVTTPDGQVCGRSYLWGIIGVDNEDHCDPVKLPPVTRTCPLPAA